MSSDCKYRDHVERLVYGGLSEQGIAKVTRHLGECATCREEHALLLVERRSFRARRDARSAPLAAMMPSFEAVLARSRVEQAREVEPVPAPAAASAGIWRRLDASFAGWRTAFAQVFVIAGTATAIFAVVRDRGLLDSPPFATPEESSSSLSSSTSGAGAHRYGRVTAMDGEASCRIDEGDGVAGPCMSVDARESEPVQEPMSSYQAASFSNGGDADRGSCASDIMCIPEPR